MAGIALARGQVIKPGLFTILAKTADTPHAPMVNELVLRSQAQAVYSADNIGHFGLGLMKYAHFTSPIGATRTFVHRALIAAWSWRGRSWQCRSCRFRRLRRAYLDDRTARGSAERANDRFIARSATGGAAVSGVSPQ